MSTTPAISRPSEPFRGVEEFRFVDHLIFHGRHNEKRSLLQKIVIHRGLLLFGDSGAGKSSLVNAALIPGVLEEKMAVDRVRLQPERGHEIVIERLPLGETGPPFLEPSLAGDDPHNTVAFSLDDFEPRARKPREWPGQPSQPIQTVLIFDQFEEIVTRFGSRDAALRDAIVRMLLRLYYDLEAPLRLLLVFREEYLAKISDLLSLAPEWLAQSFWLRPPLKSLAEAIIRAPFDPKKLSPPFSTKFSDTTIANLAAQLTAEPEDSDKLSLTDLQIACLELWRADDPDALLGEGKATGLIKRWLDRALNQLETQGYRDAAIALLSLMVTPEGTRNTISGSDAVGRVNQADPSLSRDVLLAALNALVATRLVRRETRDNSVYYSIVSEFLADRIARLRRQRDAELLSRRYREVIQSQAKRRGALAGVVLLAVLAVAGYFVLHARQKALEARLNEAFQTISQLQTEKAQAAAIQMLARARPSKTAQKETTMFGSNVLEVAFGILLLYLLLSVACSVLNELIAGVFADRQIFLRAAVDKLIDDPEYRDSFWLHPLIQSLAPPGAREPAYIPPATFSLALLDAIAPGASQDYSKVKERINALPVGTWRRALSVFMDNAQTIEDLRDSISGWFLEAMGSAGSAYKRMTEWRLLCLALVLVVALNCDTLRIADRLSSDSALRASLIAQAQAIAEAPPPSSAAASPSAAQRIQQNLTAVQSIGFPVGWNRSELHASTWEWTSRVLGWIISVIMVLFGATLWYGLISSRMVWRPHIAADRKRYVSM